MASAKQATQTAQAPPQEEEFVNSVLDGEASVAPRAPKPDQSWRLIVPSARWMCRRHAGEETRLPR